jgi:hypothetical protein
MAWSPDHSRRWSRKSTMPASAHCRSSMTITTGRCSARRSKNRRQPEKSSSFASTLGVGSPSSWPRRGAMNSRSAGSSIQRSRPVAEALGDDLLGVLLADLEPRPDHLRERPVADSLAIGQAAPGVPEHVPARPSMYLKNSQARRDLPTPATPETSTRRAEWRSASRGRAP